MTSQIQGKYFGTGSPLFRLYLKTAILTILTLGIYRFWAKTRIRKYIWSATSGDGDSFEYSGTGLEKFLGFLVAIVILAIYLGLFQLLLAFIGISIIPENESEAAIAAQAVAINLSILAVLPLILFAQYRARRYKMARSRWRGIRFGMEKGAWGYAFRALGYIFLTIITLGLLNPLATFRLEKYMADRSWYGDARFEQMGRWQDLYAGMKHVFIGLGIIVVGVILGIATEGVWIAAAAGIIGYIWLLIGLIYYRVYAFNYLTQNKVLDGEVQFDARLETGAVIGIFLVGTIVIGVLMAVVFGIIGLIVASMSGAIMAGTLSPVLFVGLAIPYALAFLIAGGLSLVMITQPMIKHAVENMTVLNADHLDTIRQRAADTGADAEGFADALDVGGAI
ncbi:DUF898 family protein [uncultured Tateyamaria sp.]|uniref:YjgN family protein n=1 Tax=uncultured Tateyamaria sp. TaxID=455651 RepID=UPI002619446E|nr:DUF898 family protein [uncultured Tateyamaria sp.]